jgi:hypothetical protein
MTDLNENGNAQVPLLDDHAMTLVVGVEDVGL